MMARPDDIRALLRLPPDTQLEEITHVPPPEAPIAEGFVATAADGDSLNPALLDALASEPHFSADEGLATLLGAAVERWEANPTIVALHGDLDVVDDAGSVTQLLGRWIIDTRGDGGAVLARQGPKAIAVMGRAGAITVAAVVPQPHIPDPDDLLAASSAPAWLIERATDWRGGTLVDQAASVGLIGRLATALTNDPKPAVAALLAGDPTPTSRAADAAAALPNDELRAIASAALTQCRDLQTRMTSRPGDVSTEAASFWHALAVDRDKLESVAWVLAASDAHEPVRAALIELDREIAMHLSELEANAEDIDDPHLGAVSWQEPEHWWGR